ncbi:MAG: hypothetical protein ABSB09_08515 [Acidimicrobiales bacterium]|jgi:hypothetical protein
MTTATEHLETAIQALMDERAEIDRQIEVLKRTLNELGGGTPSSPAWTRSGTGATGPVVIPSVSMPRQSVSDIVLKLLNERAVASLAEIMEALSLAGNNSQQDSVSSILSRMVSNELIGKGPQRGTFVRIPQVASGEQMEDILSGGRHPENDPNWIQGVNQRVAPD